MTFTVTYRAKDGALREERVEACHERGITPTGIREGRSGKSAASPSGRDGARPEMKRRDAASPSDEKRREALVLHGVEDELETLFVADLCIFLLHLSPFGCLNTLKKRCNGSQSFTHLDERIGNSYADKCCDFALQYTCKHIGREANAVTFHLLVQSLCWHSVEFRQIAVEHDLHAADRKNPRSAPQRPYPVAADSSRKPVLYHK